MDPEEAENAQLICEICSHVLIDAVETACGHVYCKYCLYMWKKHDVNTCPNEYCKKDMGKVILRPDIDKYITDFFATANPLAQNERECFLKARKKDVDIPDLEKVLFRTRNFHSGKKSSDEVPRCSSSRFPALGQRTNPARQVQETYQKLNKETKTLAGELTGTYTRILDLGANINAEEDSLAPQFFNRNLESDVKTRPMNDRPCTASPGLGITKIPHRPRDKSEVDELLKETNEIIKIEKFLSKFSFENIKLMEESEFREDLHKDAIKKLDEFIDDGGKEGRKKSPKTDIPEEGIPGFKVHPVVTDCMAKMKLKTKVTPIVPRTDKDPVVSCTPRDPKTPRGAKRPDPELLRCQEALIKIKKDLSETRILDPLSKIKKLNSAHLNLKPSTSRMPPTPEVVKRPMTQITGTKQPKPPKKSLGPETKKSQGSSASKCQIGSGDAPSASSAKGLTGLPSSTKCLVDSTEKKFKKLSIKSSTVRPNSKGQI